MRVQGLRDGPSSEQVKGILMLSQDSLVPVLATPPSPPPKLTIEDVGVIYRHFFFCRTSVTCRGSHAQIMFTCEPAYHGGVKRTRRVDEIWAASSPHAFRMP